MQPFMEDGKHATAGGGGERVPRRTAHSHAHTPLGPVLPFHVLPPRCSFVRVVLARPGSLPLAEAETRVILRNSHPLWEEW